MVGGVRRRVGAAVGTAGRSPRARERLEASGRISWLAEAAASQPAACRASRAARAPSHGARFAASERCRARLAPELCGRPPRA